MIAIWKHIQDWYRNNRKTLRVSLLVSLAITIFSYEVANSLHPMAGEYAAQKQINDFRKFLGLQQGHVPDSILFINVCYDKTLIPYEEQGMPVGNTVITDREKLLSLLTEAKKANNYRYIFMDVCFEEGLETEADSALFHTIASMDRIVIPYQNIKVCPLLTRFSIPKRPMQTMPSHGSSSPLPTTSSSTTTASLQWPCGFMPTGTIGKAMPLRHTGEGSGIPTTAGSAKTEPPCS